jgi:hypothetical protein
MARTRELTSFLSRATKAYAAGEMEEQKVSDTSFVGRFEHRHLSIVDMYTASPDKRVYNGRELVFHDGQPIWAAAYHGAIEKRVDPDEVLSVYAEALKKPARELPIRGPRRVEINGVEYRLDSLRGPMHVARFAVTEYMVKDGARIYDGHIAGGWTR